MHTFEEVAVARRRLCCDWHLSGLWPLMDIFTKWCLYCIVLRFVQASTDLRGEGMNS